MLVNDVVPYYKAKHFRQQFGFEGLDLEMKRRKEIKAAAKLIPADNIEELTDSGQYLVQSQTTRGHKYSVDIEGYACNCKSYPEVLFCKHLAAVQYHFFEDFDVHHIDSSFASAPTLSSDQPSTVKATSASNDASVLASIADKLQRLAVRTRLAPPHHLSAPFRQLDDILDQILADSAEPQVLPKQKKLPPNQNSWPETAKVMGAHIKTKRKSVHTDPYNGGQGSGKRAKADARKGLVISKANTRYVI